jgi:hypothetical protein
MTGTRSSLFARLHQALGPILGGLILDGADFVTFGALGIYVGVLVGFLVGWWITSFSSIATPYRLVVALLAGVYCAMPITEFMPIATMVSAGIRFLEEPSRGSETYEDAGRVEVEVDDKSVETRRDHESDHRCAGMDGGGREVAPGV